MPWNNVASYTKPKPHFAAINYYMNEISIWIRTKVIIIVDNQSVGKVNDPSKIKEKMF